MTKIIDKLKKMFSQHEVGEDNHAREDLSRDYETAKELKALLNQNKGHIPVHLNTAPGHFNRVYDDGLYHFSYEKTTGIVASGVFFDKEGRKKTLSHFEDLDTDTQQQLLQAAKISIKFRNRLADYIRQNNGSITLDKPISGDHSIIKGVELNEEGQVLFRGYPHSNPVSEPYFVFYEQPSQERCSQIINAIESSLRSQLRMSSAQVTGEKQDKTEHSLVRFQLKDGYSLDEVKAIESAAKGAVATRIITPSARSFTPQQVDTLKKYCTIYKEECPKEVIYRDLLRKVAEEVRNIPEQWIDDAGAELQDLAHGTIRDNNNQLKL